MIESTIEILTNHTFSFTTKVSQVVNEKKLVNHSIQIDDYDDLRVRKISGKLIESEFSEKIKRAIFII